GHCQAPKLKKPAHQSGLFYCLKFSHFCTVSRAIPLLLAPQRQCHVDSAYFHLSPFETSLQPSVSISPPPLLANFLMVQQYGHSFC
ncbi:hypothetical protein ACEUB1_21730, partial [Aeromonas dhakensis]